MAACCGCCQALRPRYKRLVDNLFPANSEEGLVKANMEKLTFFACKSPEKLDRIGQYLEQRLNRDIYRQRYAMVRIAMEALDQLLATCHSETKLNLFVESFLKMVQKLLECNEADLQILSTASFVKFAHIEEDTASYHRRYDFFISKFSSMCHNQHTDTTTRNQLRAAGLRGLQGVVRKTVGDDLQVNIWAPTHMDKIVPSLLYNMQEYRSEQAKQSVLKSVHECGEEETMFNGGAESPDGGAPGMVAETVFRDLVGRASSSYGNINSVLKPLLRHLNDHKLWVPNHFAIHCFKIIMYSVQAQNGYVVVEMLMKHLNDNIDKEPRIKASIVQVLSEAVLIAAGGSIGPSVLEVFNTLLRHLRYSVDAHTEDARRRSDELRFQDTIINTIGEFANELPDFQKIEIIRFVMDKVPVPAADESLREGKDVTVQIMLMKTMLKVATKYHTVLMQNALPTTFLEPLLRMSLVGDPGIRRIVQEILHTLLDRHDNTERLSRIQLATELEELGLNIETPPNQDIMFMKRNGHLFFLHIYENMQQANNRVDNYEALYVTASLLAVELGAYECLPELYRLGLQLQNMARAFKDLPVMHKCAIHALVAAFFNLLSLLTGIEDVVEHVQAVIAERKTNAPFYLPEVAFNRSNTKENYPSSSAMPDSWLFSSQKIAEGLEKKGFDIAYMDKEYTVRQPGAGLGVFRRGKTNTGSNSSRQSRFFFIDRALTPLGANDVTDNYPPDAVDEESVNASDSVNRSVSDLHSISDLESGRSTPASSQLSPEEITYESLKRILEVNPRAREEKEAERKRLFETMKNDTYENMVARSEAKYNKLSEILDSVAPDSALGSGADSPHSRRTGDDLDQIVINEIQYPDLFVY